MADETMVVKGTASPSFGQDLSIPGGSNAPHVPVTGHIKGGVNFPVAITPDGWPVDISERKKSEIRPDVDSLPVDTKVVVENGTPANGYRLVTNYIPIGQVEERITVLAKKYHNQQPRLILTDGLSISFDSFHQLFAFANRSKARGTPGGQNHGASTQAWAPPLTWGPWVDLASHVGVDVYTINFDTVSEAPSTFSIQIEYAGTNGMVTINTLGPGSYQVTDNNGAGTDRIRFKSHTIGQNISIQY
ncbi:TPA: hypothetical protein MEB24_000405 [Klebsiella aerogenes]|uniref:colicin Z C-terminal domain-related protein n=1 Tax=Klebsiella TaxID=570 RepID=UPI0006590584|nr:colicin Z C-terminal domain-related protein [Klebsiella aerogenes]MCL6718697.1 hypothetical protein [Klebsiella sp. T2.Ur]EIV6180514.1 hypothetical protein [Klebsiella aerogenes]EKQ6527474.1 hypothetical protein [Klebsiella aerogenes]EKU6672893.1 hypothetical protein [Klebsiella aerogenes]ELA0148248.1 hypothetical protein [Klebsiella aerogenes]